MILVDTSVRVDHLRRGDPRLVDLLERSIVIMHPFVIGEMACGNLRGRVSILELLRDLPAAAVVEGDEVLRFIERHVLHGKGIGYVDAHLLASAALTEGAKIWTRDKRLRLVAEVLGSAYQDTPHRGFVRSRSQRVAQADALDFWSAPVKPARSKGCKSPTTKT